MNKHRGKPRKAAGAGERKPPARGGSPAEGFRKRPYAGPRPEPRFSRKPPAAGAEGFSEPDFSDPYRPAQRPKQGPRHGPAKRPALRPERAVAGGRDRAERTWRDDERARHGEHEGRGFTVTLDPDVARVFRGDASVNKALRLVLQLMQVVQGPPRAVRAARAGIERPRRGYQGSPEARGFTRKPRFEEDEEG
jgi:hypothetical protein